MTPSNKSLASVLGVKGQFMTPLACLVPVGEGSLLQKLEREGCEKAVIWCAKSLWQGIRNILVISLYHLLTPRPVGQKDPLHLRDFKHNYRHNMEDFTEIPIDLCPLGYGKISPIQLNSKVKQLPCYPICTFQN